MSSNENFDQFYLQNQESKVSKLYTFMTKYFLLVTATFSFLKKVFDILIISEQNIFFHVLFLNFNFCSY